MVAIATTAVAITHPTTSIIPAAASVLHVLGEYVHPSIGLSMWKSTIRAAINTMSIAAASSSIKDLLLHFHSS